MCRRLGSSRELGIEAAGLGFPLGFNSFRRLEAHVTVFATVDPIGILQRHLVPPEEGIIHGLDAEHLHQRVSEISCYKK